MIFTRLLPSVTFRSMAFAYFPLAAKHGHILFLDIVFDDIAIDFVRSPCRAAYDVFRHGMRYRYHFDFSLVLHRY